MGAWLTQFETLNFKYLAVKAAHLINIPDTTALRLHKPGLFTSENTIPNHPYRVNRDLSSKNLKKSHASVCIFHRAVIYCLLNLLVHILKHQVFQFPF